MSQVFLTAMPDVHLLGAVMTLLQSAPPLGSKIEDIVWMGEAINLPGNLDPTTVPTPPWKIIEFPLDMTNQAAIATSFMNLVIDATLDATQGYIKKAAGGRQVQVVQNFSPKGQQALYDYVAKQLDR